MRRLKLLSSAVVALAIVFVLAPAAGAASAPLYTQCPPVAEDKGCQFLVTVTNGGLTIAGDPGQPPYVTEDALVGVQNNSSSPVSSIHLSAETELFGFEFDGLCSPGSGPMPTGCVVLPQNSQHEPSIKAGQECGFEKEIHNGKEFKETIAENCGFPPPAGEPTGLTFPEGVYPVGFGANGDPVSGYEGPTSWFTNIGPLGSNATGSGTINFSPAIPPGGSSYFSLESPPEGGFGVTPSLTTSLSGGGQSGPSITVLQGTPVTDSATLGGPNAGIATGSATYTVYSDPACTKAVVAAGTGAVNGAAVGASSPENLPPGVYYWQAAYAGDANNKPISSACGSEVLTVLAPTTTGTVQSGEGVIGATIPVLLGTSVTDQATLSGTAVAGAAGTVTYTVYSDSKCTKPLASSIGAVSAGAAGASLPFKAAKTGKYYWTATYSGGGLDAGSASPCGAEVLIVSTKAVLGLTGASKKCLSKRAFTVHPRFPKGAKIVSFEEFINGALTKSGGLSKHATLLSLIGLPKGTYKVELVTFTSTGSSYEDTRTFHTCVAKPKHKKHK